MDVQREFDTKSGRVKQCDMQLLPALGSGQGWQLFRSSTESLAIVVQFRTRENLAIAEPVYCRY